MPNASAPQPAEVEVLRRAANPLNLPADYDRIVSWVGDASVVLLGEATHGTEEFYETRALITRLLIEKNGFTAVAIEGDWPDAYRVNRYVQAPDHLAEAVEALGGFERFPTWMWRNTVVVEFISWLRARNASVEPAQQAGFYGLDLYSLRSSMNAVVDYLEKHDPMAARAARKSYGCFDQYGGDPDTYSWTANHLGSSGSCGDAVARELLALRERRATLLRKANDAGSAADEFFYAEQNALLARNAEHYYRTMFQGRAASWNVRDDHMAETLDALLVHLAHRGHAPKVVVWAHNSHLGDARATELGDNGQISLGQRVRERHGVNARLIGLTTHHGNVLAASDWGEPANRIPVRPALEGSYESLFHATGLGAFFLPLNAGDEVEKLLAAPRLERAIGVVYRPDSERLSHYFHARLSKQFDAVLHLNETTALRALERDQPAVGSEVPETFPSGI